MSWDEKAEGYARGVWPPNGGAVTDIARLAIQDGARWQREALLSDEAVERAARALYETDREEYAGDETWPTFIESPVNDMYRERARVALTAATGDR